MVRHITPDSENDQTFEEGETVVDTDFLLEKAEVG